MIKQIILIILLSLAAIFFRSELSHGLAGLIYIHHYIDKSLQIIFSAGHIGHLIQEMISLLILPLAGGFIVAAAFWMVKRVTMPHMMGIVWVLWLVLLVTMATQNGTETTDGAFASQSVSESPNTVK